MSVFPLAAQDEVQPHQISFGPNDTRGSSAVEGKRQLAVTIKSSSRIAPQHSEGAESFSAVRYINPRRSAQLVSVGQAHCGAAGDVTVHFLTPFFEITRSLTPGCGNLARTTKLGASLSSFLTDRSHADLPSDLEGRRAAFAHLQKGFAA